MVDAPDPDQDASLLPTAQARTDSWKNHHALFVLAVLTRYKVNYYEDRVVHESEIGKGIESWDEDDETLAIEEGRRQIDVLFARLQYVTSRASFMLPVGIAAAIFFLTSLENVCDTGQPKQIIAWVLLLAGSAFSIWGVLVMGALIGGRASLKQTNALLLITEPAGLRKYLASDYATNVPIGKNSNATYRGCA